MLGRIAKLYYEYDLTHQQIADLIGWSRVKVTRALAEARDQGIVRITVFSDEAVFMDEERALTERFGLETVQVGPAPSSKGDLSGLAKAGADCVARQVRDDLVVAVGLSTTLATIASTIDPGERRRAIFVPLQGTNPGLVTPPTPSNIAREFSAAFRGQHHALAAPVIASSPEVLELLQNDPNVIQAFETARQADLALVGIGGIEMNSSIILSGNLSADDAAELQSQGAVGDVNARFFDNEGRGVQTDQTSLVLGLTLDQFTDIPLRIAAAAGRAKVGAIAAALRGEIVNGLITDEPTAKALLAL